MSQNNFTCKDVPLLDHYMFTEELPNITFELCATKSSLLILLYFKKGHDSLKSGESLKRATGAWVTKDLGQKFLKP